MKIQSENKKEILKFSSEMANEGGKISHFVTKENYIGFSREETVS